MIPFSRSLADVEVLAAVKGRGCFAPRLLYGAMRRAPDGTKHAVVVKFTATYSRAVHEAWAASGLAPELYECEALPGGWWAIVMEQLRPPEWQMLEKVRQETKAAWYEEAQIGLLRAHAVIVADGTGVHGDVRRCNIMCRGEAPRGGGLDVRFIDFDWAGLAGKAKYPLFMSRGIPWPDGVEAGKLIMPEHDVELLRRSCS
jgi:hypothetical protein